MSSDTVTQVFGATSTTEDVLSGINLRGKRILVTGVSAGLGVETARSLAAHGADVVGAARDLKKAEAATVEVRRDAAANGVGRRFGSLIDDRGSVQRREVDRHLVPIGGAEDVRAEVEAIRLRIAARRRVSCVERPLPEVEKPRISQAV